ncbi:Unknown protein, partial [Striga hermonthica]
SSRVNIAEIMEHLEECNRSLRASVAPIPEKDDIESLATPSLPLEHPSVGQPCTLSSEASFPTMGAPSERHQEVLASTQEALASLASIIEEFH